MGRPSWTPLPETLSLSPLKFLSGTLEGPQPSGSPCVGSANAQAAEAAALTHGHAPCMSAHPHAHAGGSPRRRPHAHRPPLPGPLHTNTACTHTHTHTHTRQEPGSRRDPERGHLGLQLWPPPHPAISKPLAATPRTELCNWVENCKNKMQIGNKPKPTHRRSTSNP